MDGVIGIAQANGQGMSNVTVGDLIMYTTNSNQGIHIGASNMKPVISGNGSNLQLNGVVGVNKAPNPSYAVDVGGALNTTALNIAGSPFVAGGGNFTLVATTAVAGVNAITFSNLTYDKYQLIVPFAAPTANDTLRILASSNNGSTWFATGYNSVESYTSAAAPGTWTGTTVTTYLKISYGPAFNDAIAGGTSGSVHLYNTGTSNALRMRGEYATSATLSSWAMGNCMGLCGTNVVNINALQVSWLTGSTLFSASSRPISLYAYL